MELNFAQHRLLTQLAPHTYAVSIGQLKPKVAPAVRDPLIAAQFIEAGKNGRSSTLRLTDAGRKFLLDHPEPPVKAKPKPPARLKPPLSFPFPAQRVFMLKLAFAQPDESRAGLSKALKAADRKALEEMGWVEVRSTRPSLRCDLTDAGWQWIEAHLCDEIGGNPAGDALGAVLARVGAFLKANDLRLADLVRAKSRPAEPPAPESDATSSGASDGRAAEPPVGDLTEAIHLACKRLAHNSLSPHVFLADLRPALHPWDRATVDAALLELELAERVRLVRMDDPREIRPRDREAELRTPSGEPRHLLYWVGL